MRGFRCAALVFALVTSVTPRIAEAGRRPFLFTWDTEAVNKGDIEIEQWLWARSLGGPTRKASGGWLWFSPVYGLFDHVELAMPWEATVETATGTTRLTNFTFEGRFRIFDPNEEHFVRLLVRAYYQQNLNHPDNVGMGNKPYAGADFVMSLGDVAGTHGTINVGGMADLGFGALHLYRQTASAGFTLRLSDEWRIGAEYTHELNFGDAPFATATVGSGATLQRKNNFRFYAGPNVAFSRGRVWITLGSMIGLTDTTPLFMPRLMIAVAI